MLCGERDEVLTFAGEEWIGAYEERINTLLGEADENLIEIAFADRPQDCEPDTEDVRRGLRLPYLRLSDGAGRVDEQSDQFGLRQQVVHELQSFFGQGRQDHPNSGDVPVGFVEAGNKAELERVGAGDEDDWDRWASSLGCKHCWWPDSEDHSHLMLHEISRHCWQRIITVSNPAVFGRYVLTLEITHVRKT